MKEYVDDEEVQHKEWNLEIERPYGNYSWKIKYQAITNDPNEEIDDLPPSNSKDG
jgi:disulfide oxidoreductase YuzD